MRDGSKLGHVRGKAARELTGILGKVIPPELVVVTRGGAAGFSVQVDVAELQFRAGYSWEGLRTFGWEGRRDPATRRGWRRWLPWWRRARWRHVSSLADAAEVL